MTTRLRSARETRRRAMTARPTLVTFASWRPSPLSDDQKRALAATTQQEDGLLTE
jgi:hypothetical protein